MGGANHRAWQIGELVRLCDNLGTPRPIIVQPLYNTINRLAESDLQPACDYFGISVVPYSPLARGVLTGKYALNQDAPNNSRAGRGDANLLARDMKKNLDIVKNIEKVFEK